jgi:hypothetical protein
MSIRISEEAECEYNKIIAARNFRQKEQIISAYNDSIKCYKRFRTAIEIIIWQHKNCLMQR